MKRVILLLAAVLLLLTGCRARQTAKGTNTSDASTTERDSVMQQTALHEVTESEMEIMLPFNERTTAQRTSSAVQQTQVAPQISTATQPSETGTRRPSEITTAEQTHAKETSAVSTSTTKASAAQDKAVNSNTTTTTAKDSAAATQGSVLPVSGTPGTTSGMKEPQTKTSVPTLPDSNTGGKDRFELPAIPLQ